MANTAIANYKAIAIVKSQQPTADPKCLREFGNKRFELNLKLNKKLS